MKITIELWNRKNQHSVRKQNEMLLVTLESMARELAEEREAHAETKKLLREALSTRVAKGHSMRQALKVVEGGQARLQLTTEQVAEQFAKVNSRPDHTA